MIMPKNTSTILGLALLLLAPAQGQRFLRDGFSSTMDSEFKSEMGLDEAVIDPSGMTREMLAMQGLEWELSMSPETDASDNAMLTPTLQQHLSKHLAGPLAVKLSKRPATGSNSNLGYRAVATTPNGKKLRAFWRQAAPQDPARGTDFLTLSYDEAVRSRLFRVELEVQLPRIANKAAQKKDVPSVVYQVAVETGNMNPKAVVTRGDSLVKVYPARDQDAKTWQELGAGKVGLRLKPGIVDPNWARGRSIIRKGRSTGYI